MLDILKLKLGPLNTNCYLVIDGVSGQCLVVDPADEAEAIGAEIMRQNLQLVAMVATHGHYDHIMAAYQLELSFNLPLMVHNNDKFLVDEVNKRANYWRDFITSAQPPRNLKFISEGDEVKLGDYRFQILHTPGHTPGGICLYNTQEKIAFTGDTMFAGTVGRTDFSYGSSQQLKQSLQQIKKILAGFRGYPGHGYDFTV